MALESGFFWYFHYLKHEHFIKLNFIVNCWVFTTSERLQCYWVFCRSLSLSGLFLTELCVYAYILKHFFHMSKCYFRFRYLYICVYVHSFIWLFCCICRYIYVKILVSGNGGCVCSLLLGCVHLFLYVLAFVLITCLECLCSCQWVRVQFNAHLISPFFYLIIIYIESFL